MKIERRISDAEMVCERCGLAFGKGTDKIHSYTFIGGKCDVCQKDDLVTDFRNFGYAKDEYYRKYAK